MERMKLKYFLPQCMLDQFSPITFSCVVYIKAHLGRNKREVIAAKSTALMQSLIETMLWEMKVHKSRR